MTPMDPPFVPAQAGPVRIAKAITEALVYDLKCRPGDFVYQKSVERAFMTRGLAVEEVRRGLENAMARGWLTFDSGQGIYTLTPAGFAIV